MVLQTNFTPMNSIKNKYIFKNKVIKALTEKKQNKYPMVYHSISPIVIVDLQEILNEEHMVLLAT